MPYIFLSGNIYKGLNISFTLQSTNFDFRIFNGMSKFEEMQNEIGNMVGFWQGSSNLERFSHTEICHMSSFYASGTFPRHICVRNFHMRNIMIVVYLACKLFSLLYDFPGRMQILISLASFRNKSMVYYTKFYTEGLLFQLKQTNKKRDNDTR